MREIDGEEVVFERKAIEKLTVADLEKIPVPAPYGKVGDPDETARRDWSAELRRMDRAPENRRRGQAAALAEGRHHPQGARRNKDKVGVAA